MLDKQDGYMHVVQRETGSVCSVRTAMHMMDDAMHTQLSVYVVI